MVPRAASSRRTRRRRTSSMRKRSLRSGQGIATGTLDPWPPRWAAMRPVHVSLAVLVAAIWGLNFVIIDVGLDDFPPLLLSALRFALASLPLVLLRGGPGVPWRWVLAVAAAIGIVKFSLLFVGMDVGM